MKKKQRSERREKVDVKLEKEVVNGSSKIGTR